MKFGPDTVGHTLSLSMWIAPRGRHREGLCEDALFAVVSNECQGKGEVWKRGEDANVRRMITQIRKSCFYDCASTLA